MRSIALLGLVTACVPSPAPVGVGRPAAPPPPPQTAIAPPPAQPYLPDEALADAMSSPLEIVGVGSWPGTFRRLACFYRNARVFVIDEKCSSPAEPTAMSVHVLSPTRGRVTIYADGARKISAATRADYTLFGAATAEVRPAPARLDLGMTYEDVLAYVTEPPGKIAQFCTVSIATPAGHCTKLATMTPGDYAARVSPFVAQPPPSWFAL